MVKLITCIIALLVLSLSVVPCSDSATDITDMVNHSEHSNDYCTPFCTCACCGIAFSMSVLGFEDTEQKNIELINYYPQYSSLYTHRSITSIWRPPAFIK